MGLERVSVRALCFPLDTEDAGSDSMDGYGVPHPPEAPSDLGKGGAALPAAASAELKHFPVSACETVGPFQNPSCHPLCGPRKYVL